MLKSRKIALFLVTLLYAVYTASVTSVHLEVFLETSVFVRLNFFFSFLAIILTVFYLIHIVRNVRIASLEIKGLWVVVLLSSNLATMLVYWFVHIWRDGEMEDERSLGSPTSK